MHQPLCGDAAAAKSADVQCLEPTGAGRRAAGVPVMELCMARM